MTSLITVLLIVGITFITVTGFSLLAIAAQLVNIVTELRQIRMSRQ